MFATSAFVFLAPGPNPETFIILILKQKLNFADKQQEVDIQSLRTNDDVIDNSQQQQQPRTGNDQSGTRKPAGTMSQISGVRRSLSHANSLPAGSTPLPKYGVHTDKEPELSEVSKDR